MARISIRPDELARLARRFDAVADELSAAGRRLAGSRAETRLNPADEEFPVSRLAERAALVEANLRRLAVEFQVDAGLMARTVDAAEFDGDARWTLGLLANVGFEARGSAPGVGSLESVVTGLASLGGRTPTADEVGSLGVGPIGAGGLFAISPGADRQDLLVRLTERLGASASGASGDPVADPDPDPDPDPGRAAGAVWTRLAGELFEADDGS